MYTVGSTGAQLELIGKEASLYCLRHDLPAITQDILIEQINIVRYGENLSSTSLDKIFNEIAINQAGHAILLKTIMPHVNIKQITIIPKVNDKGFILNSCEEHKNEMSIKDFKNRICVSLAGRMSQIKKYGALQGTDSRATSDLAYATKDAYNAISKYGMDINVGHINIVDLDGSNNKYYHNKINTALEHWMQEAEQNTINLIDLHWEKIEMLSKLLLEKEVLYNDDLNDFLELSNAK